MTSLPLHPHQAPPVMDELDPANQQLAEALHKSFRVLKLLMLVLVLLYFLSGWFSVKPGEAGVVLRYGRIVGATADGRAGTAVLPPGWHWSWPYPIERWMTVSTSERELPVQFMFQLTDEELTGGIKGYRYDNLSPARDDYLITGDVNLLHASLVIKYRISDPVAYLTNVRPGPAPEATPRSKPHLRYPEYALLTGLVRDVVIEAAARREALLIRGAQQDEFLLAVAAGINRRLKELERRGVPLGIEVDPATGVIAPKTSNIEGILPPRQTQEAFESVDKAQAAKVVAITKADSDAQELLLRTAGPLCQEIAEAVDNEFRLLCELSRAEAQEARSAPVQTLIRRLADQRKQTEELLLAASGDVQRIIKQAAIQRDRMVKEAAADHARFVSLLPEFLKNPSVFRSRLAMETYAEVLDNLKISKMFVPEKAGRIWLQIPRAARSFPAADQTREEREKEKPGVIKDSGGAGPEVSVQ